MKLRDKHSKGEQTLSEKIVALNEEVIKGQLKELVRGRVEVTLNEPLEQKASRHDHDIVAPHRGAFMLLYIFWLSFYSTLWPDARFV